MVNLHDNSGNIVGTYEHDDTIINLKKKEKINNIELDVLFYIKGILKSDTLNDCITFKNCMYDNLKEGYSINQIYSFMEGYLILKPNTKDCKIFQLIYDIVLTEINKTKNNIFSDLPF